MAYLAEAKGSTRRRGLVVSGINKKPRDDASRGKELGVEITFMRARHNAISTAEYSFIASLFRRVIIIGRTVFTVRFFCPQETPPGSPPVPNPRRAGMNGSP